MISKEGVDQTLGSRGVHRCSGNFFVFVNVLWASGLNIRAMR